MTSLCTFDANVLIYALDESAGRKRIAAKEIVVRLASTVRPVVPLQTLSEFYRATTRKVILLPDAARAVVAQYQAFGKLSRQAPRPSQMRWMRIEYTACSSSTLCSGRP